MGLWWWWLLDGFRVVLVAVVGEFMVVVVVVGEFMVGVVVVEGVDGGGSC